MDRRSFLATGAAGLATLAGCTGGSGSDSGSGLPTSGEDSPPYAHALDALDSQPYKGPAPGEADGLIVAFEDPSCPRCQAFEEQVVPKIESNLVETGKASFVFRGYPVVYPWGEPACHALEATFARDADVFWTLVDHYFANSAAFEGLDARGVYEKTAAFLNEGTDVDGDAVVEAADSEAVKAAVGTDLEAGRQARVGRTTPTLFLFRNGDYLTTATGSVSYTVIESALDV